MPKEDSGFDRKVQRIEWIPCKQISVVWVQAQRELDPKHAKNIADNFDPDMFGTLSVTLPNGKGIYHVIDGHHRKVAVESMWGTEEKVPCEVFNASDPARAATLFDKINSARKNPRSIDLFRVRVTAGDETSIAVNRIVIANGCHIGSRGDKSVACVDALLSVYRSHSGDILDKTFQVMHATWGMDRNSYVAPLFRGYGEFLSEYGRHINYERLRECISKRYTPGRFIGAAKTAREMNGGSIANSIKTLILANYNRGLRAALHLKKKEKKEDVKPTTKPAAKTTKATAAA